MTDWYSDCLIDFSQGPEAGSIIGRKGETVKNIRAESQAQVNIEGDSQLERIITVRGKTDSIFKVIIIELSKFDLIFTDWLIHVIIMFWLSLLVDMVYLIWFNVSGLVWFNV